MMKKKGIPTWSCACVILAGMLFVPAIPAQGQQVKVKRLLPYGEVGGKPRARLFFEASDPSGDPWSGDTD